MATQTVAKDDLRNTVRSYTTIALGGVLVVLVLAILGFQQRVYDDPYVSLFSLMWLVTFVGPLVIAPLTYHSIVGDRTSGAIKYALGLPNRRLEYVLGTSIARAGIATAIVVAAGAGAFLLAALTFSNAPSIRRFATFTGLSVLYLLAFVGIFVAISAIARTRAQAMFGVFTVYFLLVPFWLGASPFMSLQTLLDAIDTAVVPLSNRAKDAIISLSPATAYLGTNELVYYGVIDQHEMLQSTYSGGDQFYYNRAYNALVMAGWAVVSLVVGFLQFRRSELT